MNGKVIVLPGKRAWQLLRTFYTDYFSVLSLFNSCCQSWSDGYVQLIFTEFYSLLKYIFIHPVFLKNEGEGLL